MLSIHVRTLNDPRSFTLHASLTFRPAGTVIFPISSTNSGSGMVVTEKNNILHKHISLYIHIKYLK